MISTIKRKAIKLVALIVVLAIGASLLGSLIPGHPWIILVLIGLAGLVIWRKTGRRPKRRRPAREPRGRRAANGDDGEAHGSLEGRG